MGGKIETAELQELAVMAKRRKSPAFRQYRQRMIGPIPGTLGIDVIVRVGAQEFRACASITLR